MKRVSVTITDDLFMHLEALKMYYGYPSRAEVIRKALDELIKKHSSNDVFRYYLNAARKRLKDKEVQDDSKV